jgi:3',5'-cyclic AMP phosphodiesterase CpdA
MMKQAALGFLTLVAFHFGASPASAAVISDSVFNDSDWTHSILWSVGTVTLGPCGQVLTGGNPNEHQQGHHTTQDQFSGIYDGHLFVGGGTYDPGTDGPIATLDVSYDYRDVAGAFTTQNGLMIVQGIRTFLYFVDSAGPHPTWTSLSVTGITDIWNPAWVEVTGGVIINFTTPDFSISGLPMTFGYYTFNQFTADQTWGIDNFNVTIHSEPTPAEDASWGEVKASYR